VRPVVLEPLVKRSIQRRPSGLKHHLDEAVILEIAGDGPRARCADERAAGEGFGSKRNRRHGETRDGAARGDVISGVD